jgi:hypothetical protein
MYWHMRTTLWINEQLLADAKRHALETGRTLTAVLEEALRQMLYRAPPQPDEDAATSLPTWGHGGTRPGVDLDDSSSLEDVMGGTS